MPEELKEEPMIDVGETEGAEIDLEKDNSAPEQEELQVEQTTDSGERYKQETEETKKRHHRKKNLNNIVKVSKSAKLT